jgi:hypothetical protein
MIEIKVEFYGSEISMKEGIKKIQSMGWELGSTEELIVVITV